MTGEAAVARRAAAAAARALAGVTEARQQQNHPRVFVHTPRSKMTFSFLV